MPLTKNTIKLTKSLADKRSRTEHGLFVAEGRKLVEEVCRAGMRVRDIFATEGVAGVRGAEIHTISPTDMGRISSLKTASDILAVVEIPRHQPLDTPSADTLTLALDNVQDPGNMGTIIRIADWFGISDIVCSMQSADCYNPKVVQATMGAIARVRVHYTDLEAFVSAASQAAVPVYGTFLEGDNIYGHPLSAGGIVVMGSEGDGISGEIEKLVSRKLFIPPFPADGQSSESLNVAVATAITCSEFRRRALGY